MSRVLALAAVEAPSAMGAVARGIQVIAFALSILIVLGLFLWTYRLAIRRRGVRLGSGIAVMAFGLLLSHQICMMNPQRNFLIATAVGLLLAFVGGLAIGTAVYPRSLRHDRDI